MAAAGGAGEGPTGAFLPARHEFPAAVHSVSADVGRVILLALPISDGSHGIRGIGRVFGEVIAASLEYNLAFLHVCVCV